MSSYVFTLLAVSVIGGIATSFIDEENSALKKRLNFVIGLLCAIALVSPIASALKNANQIKNTVNSMFESVTEDNSEANRLILEVGTEKITEGIKSSVVEKFKIQEDDVKVVLLLNKDNIEAVKITQITVSLFNKATWLDEYEIKKYIEELTGCTTKVIKRQR